MITLRKAGIACWLTLILTMSSFSGSARADVITTLFASNNGLAGNMFDVNVLAPSGMTVHAFDLNLTSGTWDVNLYTLDGSYIGNEANATAWTLVDSVTGLVSAGDDIPTYWDIANYPLAPGAQAFYVEVTNGNGILYTNGNAEGDLVASDGNIEIFEGTGNFANFGAFQFRPRVWNGSIYYAVPEPQAVVLLLWASSLMGVGRRRKPR